MKKFEEIGPQIVDFVRDPAQLNKQLFAPWRGVRFIVCGTSGSGKTRAIGLANTLLADFEQIAESQEIIFERDLVKAIETFKSADLEYEASLHIGFNVIDGNLAEALEKEGVKVFWFDSGSRGNHWNSGSSTSEA